MGAMTTPPLSISQRLAENVQRLRKEKGWSQSRLGIEAQLHHNQISSIERARSNIRIDIAEKLALALGVSIGDLLD